MERKTKLLGALLLACAALCAVWRADANAADHFDPSDRVTAGDATDIGDLYAWHAEGDMNVILTFAGPVMPGTAAQYSRDAVYYIHIDGADDDLEPDRTLRFRFAQNDAGDWGIWGENIPGADADIVGAVGENLTSNTAMLHAGLHDDPFFFDLEGFGDTLATGALAFDGTRDSLAGQNINAIVAKFPLDALGIDGPYNIWATTGMATP